MISTNVDSISAQIVWYTKWLCLNNTKKHKNCDFKKVSCSKQNIKKKYDIQKISLWFEIIVTYITKYMIHKIFWFKLKYQNYFNKIPKFLCHNTKSMLITTTKRLGIFKISNLFLLQPTHKFSLVVSFFVICVDK